MKRATVVEQAWFPGVHSDVGGGYAETGLSDITLQWMMDRVSQAGLVFGESLLQKNPLHPEPLMEPMHVSRRGLYRLTPGFDRPIGLSAPKEGGLPSPDAESDATQSIHPSVLERWDQDSNYRPDNLREYFRRVGDGRAGA